MILVLRRLAAWLVFALLPAVVWCGSALAQQLQPLPALTARVTDTTGTLSAGERQQLENQLAALETRKGSQLVVVLVPSTQPEPISDYSIRLAEAWKIGRGQVQGRKVDDGVILLVAKNDRRVRIEVGYGLEGAIPDALAKRIIVEAIAPRFREGNFYGGIQAGVNDLVKLIDGEVLPEPWREAQKSSGDQTLVGEDLIGTLVFLFVGGLFATIILGRFLGSLAGGIGAGTVATMFGLASPLAIGAGVAAFVLFMLIAPGRSGLSRVGRHTYRPGSVIGPGGWGGGWGGGGGGGGFGGGGGGFGGGGASGDW